MDESNLLPSKRPRVKELSNFIISRTDWILKEIGTFIELFNQAFDKAKISQFVINDVDYLFVAMKETLEI